MEEQELQQEFRGRVTETLPGFLFRVAVDNNSEEEVLAYLSGRMRLKRIRVLVGDEVIVFRDKYGGRGRIIQRL